MTRLTLSLLAVVISAIVGVGWGIDQWYAEREGETEYSTLGAYKNVGRDLAILIDQQGVQVEWDDWFAFSNLHPQVIPYSEFPLPGNLKHKFEQGEALLLESGDQLSLNYYLASQDQVLSLMLPDELRQEPGDGLNWLLTLLFYGGVILVVLIWLYPLLRRLSLLRRMTEEFGSGNLHARIATDNKSYIASIEQEFNRMAQRIEQLVADNKLLSRGLSHDLRTPLARLRFGLDMLGESELPSSQQQQLAHLNRDLLAMESLVEALLNYARFDQAHIKFQPAPLLVADFLQQLHCDFYHKQVELSLAPNLNGVRINAEAEYLAMLVHNLLENALRHGAGKVALRAAVEGSELHMCIDDDGPGIPVAERAKVVKPFYRATTASQTQGFGLGLAMVERIAQWHHARLLLEESARLGGLRARVVFPLVQD